MYDAPRLNKYVSHDPEYDADLLGAAKAALDDAEENGLAVVRRAVSLELDAITERLRELGA